VKLESGRKNITEETQVLNIDGKSTNNSQTITSTFNKYFLLPDKKKVSPITTMMTMTTTTTVTPDLI